MQQPTSIPSHCGCCLVASVVSDSLGPSGLYPARLLCPWDFPGKNTGVGCHFLLQPRDRTRVSCKADFFTTELPRKLHPASTGPLKGNTRLLLMAGTWRVCAIIRLLLSPAGDLSPCTSAIPRVCSENNSLQFGWLQPASTWGIKLGIVLGLQHLSLPRVPDVFVTLDLV